MTSRTAGTFDICMLIPPLGAGGRVNPQVAIFNHLTTLGHRMTWVVALERKAGRPALLPAATTVHNIPTALMTPDRSLFVRALNRLGNLARRNRSVRRLFRQQRFDLIFVRDDPYDAWLAGRLAKKYRIPFAYELTDPLDQKLDLLKLEPRRPVWLHQCFLKFDVWLRVRAMNRADLVLPTTEWFEPDLSSRGIPSSKLLPYPNGVDTELFKNQTGNAVRKTYRVGAAPLIIYVGVISRSRNLDLLMDAFALVAKAEPMARLMLVGEGDALADLKAKAGDLGLGEQVIFTGRVAQADVPDYIAAADIGVSPIPPTTYFRVSSPIKLFEYMGMGKPVVANEEILEHRRVVAESGAGRLVAYSPEAFADAIMQLLRNAEERRTAGEKGRAWLREHRSYDVLARRLEARLRQLIETRLLR